MRVPIAGLFERGAPLPVLWIVVTWIGASASPGPFGVEPLAAAQAAVQQAVAQGTGGVECNRQDCPVTFDDWRGGTSGQLVALGANVFAGALTGGVRQWRSDGSFLDGFWRGAAGGAGTYVGKRISASDLPVAGVLGRGIGAVGSSMTRNAADGRPTFDRLVLPLGPVRFHWDRAEGEVYRSIDLFTVGGLVWAYSAGLGTVLDLRRSLGSGTLVFLAREWEDDFSWHARHVGGTIVLRGDQPGTLDHHDLLVRALAHERVHVVQYDQAYILWSEALEHRLLERLGAPDWVVRSAGLSLHGPVFSSVNLLLSHSLRPWEIEAHIFAETFSHD